MDPLVYETFEEHTRHARRFSRSEVEAIAAMVRGEPCPLAKGRVRRELFEKLGILDETAPDTKPAAELQAKS